MDLADVSDADLALVGGKAGKLGEMVRQGLPVPPGFVLTTEAYRAFVNGTSLKTEIPAILSTVDAARPASTEEASRQIREAFNRAEFPPDLRAQVASAYDLFVTRHNVHFSA